MKEEVVDWADTIITRDENPDIFFIDLALSSSKSINDIINYISNFLSSEQPITQGRHLLGFLYKKFKTGKISLEQTVSLLFSLRDKAVFTDEEEHKIYYLDDAFHLANANIWGTLEEVQKDTDRFLKMYKGFSIDNIEQLQNLNK